MFIYDRMTEDQFTNAFLKSELRREQFSRPALRRLFDWYEEQAEELQKPVEFDMIAICCEWRELTISELAEASTDLAVRFLGTYGNLHSWDEPDEVLDPTNGMLVLKVEHYKEPTTFLVQSEV